MWMLSSTTCVAPGLALAIVALVEATSVQGLEISQRSPTQALISMTGFVKHPVGILKITVILFRYMLQYCYCIELLLGHEY